MREKVRLLTAQGESKWPWKGEQFSLYTLGGGTSMYRMKIPASTLWGTRAYFNAIRTP